MTKTAWVAVGAERNETKVQFVDEVEKEFSRNLDPKVVRGFEFKRVAEADATGFPY